MKRLSRLLFVLLPCWCSIADGSPFEVSPPTDLGERGMEITVGTTFDEQKSGATGRLTVRITYEGGLLAFEDAAGKHYDIFHNSDSTIIGFNFSPAAEVNQVILVLKTGSGNTLIIPNLAESVFGQLKSLGKRLDEEDKSYVFLQKIDQASIQAEYRGPKMENPPVAPFRFQVKVARDGALTVINSSIRPL